MRSGRRRSDERTKSDSEITPSFVRSATRFGALHGADATRMSGAPGLEHRAKLIPQGARLIGIYDSQVAFGQSRVLLVWTRLIMPNGRSIVLEHQQGADSGGYSGL